MRLFKIALTTFVLANVVTALQLKSASANDSTKMLKCISDAYCEKKKPGTKCKHFDVMGKFCM